MAQEDIFKKLVYEDKYYLRYNEFFLLKEKFKDFVTFINLFHTSFNFSYLCSDNKNILSIN